MGQMMFKKILPEGGGLEPCAARRYASAELCYLLSHRNLRLRQILFSICGVLLVSVLGNICGCRTSQQLPATNLSEPGWNVRQGQAIWRRETGAPEIAGELLVSHTNEWRGLCSVHEDAFSGCHCAKDPSAVANPGSCPKPNVCRPRQSTRSRHLVSVG